MHMEYLVAFINKEEKSNQQGAAVCFPLESNHEMKKSSNIKIIELYISNLNEIPTRKIPLGSNLQEVGIRA